MAMKSIEPLRRLCREFGGTVREQRGRSIKHAIYYRWLVSGEQAALFAEAVLPYLLIKDKQARLVIRFQTYKRANINRPNNDRRHARLTQMYEAMKALNQRGPKGAT